MQGKSSSSMSVLSEWLGSTIRGEGRVTIPPELCVEVDAYVRQLKGARARAYVKHEHEI